jgi:hypothetical protein
MDTVRGIGGYCYKNPSPSPPSRPGKARWVKAVVRWTAQGVGRRRDYKSPTTLTTAAVSVASSSEAMVKAGVR